MGQPVVHFEVLGKDGDALAGFYGEAFGWQISSDNPAGYGVVDTQADGKGIAGGVGSAQEGGSGWVTFYVEVPDLDEAVGKVEQLGGSKLAGPMEVPGDGPRLAIVADPEGHTIGLVEA